MNDINNDEVRLFGSGKKLTFSDCPDTSLDGIGSDLLSHDFLKDNVIARSDSSNFPDPLLIINSELSSQRHITLDDVVRMSDVDLDLSLSTLDNNGIQHPQEPLGFNDFLSGSGFCLNGLSEKLSEPDKLGFGGFGDVPGDGLSKIQGKAFKIVPTYVDGKLTNTLHLEEHVSNDKMFDIPSTSSAVSAGDKITATIEDFPSMSMVSGNTLTLNGQVQATVASIDIASDISDLITVKPREPKKPKKKHPKLALAPVKARKKKKRLEKLKQAALENTANKKTASLDNQKKKSGSAVSSTPSDATTVKSTEPQPKNGIPKFKIIQQAEPSTSGETSSVVTTSKFVNGSVFPPTSEPNGAPPAMQLLNVTTATVVAPVSAGTITVPAAPRPLNQPQTVELILPVISVRDDSSTKTVLKSIADLKAGDMPAVNQGLSQDQKQQIAVILKQREALKRATGSSSNGPKRNDNKIICKVLFPEDFVNEPAGEESQAKPGEDGRSVESPPKPKKPKVAKPRQTLLSEEFEAEIPLSFAPSVTRSGRTSRPPKKLVKRDCKSTVDREKADEPKQPTGTATASADGADVAKNKPELLDGLPAKKKLAKRSANYTCQTCGRSYVELKIFLKHLEAFPTHVGNESATKAIEESLNPGAATDTSAKSPKRKCRCKCRSYETCRARSLSFKQMVDTISERDFVRLCGPRFVKTTSVWDFLLLRIKALYKYEDYVKGVLSELGKLWDSLKAVSTKILFPSSLPSETTVTIEDSTTCEALGVSKGVYQTFPSELDIPAPTVANDQNQTDTGDAQPSAAVAPPDTREDISQSSLLSDILCDKSGMDTVDQLVNERLKTLAPGDDILEPPSDDLMTSILNSVHSHSLTDSMFNPLVSSSNEDLLKALENLSNPIDNPPPLDFTALTNDYPDR